MEKIDREYSNYAYIKASAVGHSMLKDAVLDHYQGGGRRGIGVLTDGVYGHPQWPGHRVDRSREFSGPASSHHHTSANLYHIASNRTISYASSDELQSAVPITAAATASRFLEPAPRWPSAKHGGLEGACRQQNGNVDAAGPNLTTGICYVGDNSSPYSGSEASLPGKSSYGAMPRHVASPPVHYETPPHLRAAAAETSCDAIELSPAGSPAVVMRGQNYVEVSKPFEMADVYKYSSRMRRAGDSGGDRTAGDLRSTSSPHLTTYTREPQQYWDQQQPIPITQYLPSRHYRNPAFD